MPRLSLLLLLATLSLSASIAEAQLSWSKLFGGKKADEAATTVEWLDDSTAALAESARTGKPIVAYVTSKNCGYCRKMERETWSEPAVGRLVERSFIPLKLHADKHPEAVAALRVRAYPTTLLISSEGKAFDGHTGFMEPAELTKLMRPAVKPKPKTVASR